MKHSLVLAVSILCSAPLAHAAPQAPYPPHGETVDTAARVATLTNIPNPCIAIDIGSAILVVSASSVSEIATTELPPDAPFEPRNIRARAKSLLKALSANQTLLGCRTLLPSPSFDDAGYFEYALHEGNVAVVDKATQKPFEFITVRFLSTKGIGGHVIYYLPSGSVFFRHVWWAS